MTFWIVVLFLILVLFYVIGKYSKVQAAQQDIRRRCFVCGCWKAAIQMYPYDMWNNKVGKGKQFICSDCMETRV